MLFAHTRHNHMPFPMACRYAGDTPGSSPGPPGHAATMWHASPTFDEPACAFVEPLVGAREPGFEQRNPTRAASVLFVR
jgi:hypothetical protein